ncbi:MAG: nucleotidyl transferase AbiEii/AbiGii toxin family protein [Nitrospinota bacterium]
MDFKVVLEKLLNAFEKKNIRYALMGGFAMGLWGGSRSTVDLDFLVHRDDREKAHKILTDIGRENLVMELLKRYFKIFNREDLYKKIFEGDKK